MAKDKKSFIAYLDWGDIFNELPDEQAGKLIKHIFAYVKDENPIAEDVLINVAFAGIKADLKRDLKKWECYMDKQRANGQKGGRPKKTQKTQPFFQKPKKAVNVNVNVNDNVNDIVVTRAKFFEIAMNDEIWMNGYIAQYNLDKRGISMMLKDFGASLDVRKEKDNGRDYEEWCRYFNNYVLRRKSGNRQFFDKYRV